MTAIWIAASVIVAYLLGSIPTGLVATWLVKGIDIRQVGSGRTGATNAYRAAGPWGAALTSAGDIFKGVFAVWIARFLMMLVVAPAWTAWVETMAGIAVIAGHNWSILLKFKGGAGTATTIGVLATLNIYVTIAIMLIGFLALVISRMASIGSISLAVLMGVGLALTAAFDVTPWAYVPFGVVAGGLTVLALRPNIKRILSNQERQLKVNY